MKKGTTSSKKKKIVEIDEEKNQQNKERIIEATIVVFNKKGIKFTMDDVTKEINMSKKTLYNTFKDKSDLFTSIVDYCFDKIKESEQQVIEDDSLDTVEKLRKLLGAMPDAYQNINFEELHILRDKYPKIYDKVKDRIETGWDSTIELIEKGIEEGVLRPVNTLIVKSMFESTLEKFFQNDILLQCNMSYSEGLSEVVNLMVDGMKVSK